MNPSIDPGLEAIIVKAMQKRAADRYSSADEMREDLLRVVSGEPVHAASAAAGAMVAGGAAAAAAARMDKTSVLPTVGADGSNGYGQPPVRRAAPKKRPVWPWILAVVLLALAGLGVAWGMGAFGPKSASVPDVIGKTRAEAQATPDRGRLRGRRRQRGLQRHGPRRRRDEPAARRELERQEGQLRRADALAGAPTWSRCPPSPA